MRLHPAPNAARIASSCRRPSTRTSSKFATFAQAISSTIAMDPISTHKTLPTSPTTSCFNGRRFGAIPAFSNSFMLNPSGAGKLRFAIGNMRATSALACAIVTPGFSRAIA